MRYQVNWQELRQEMELDIQQYFSHENLESAASRRACGSLQAALKDIPSDGPVEVRAVSPDNAIVKALWRYVPEKSRPLARAVARSYDRFCVKEIEQTELTLQ